MRRPLGKLHSSLCTPSTEGPNEIRSVGNEIQDPVVAQMCVGLHFSLVCLSGEFSLTSIYL